MFKTEKRFKEKNEFERIGIAQTIMNHAQRSETYDSVVLNVLRVLRDSGIIEDIEDDKE